MHDFQWLKRQLWLALCIPLAGACAKSTKGTETTDTYSLAGVTAAMAAIDAACP